MSATLPPAADFERPSDFGEFWPQAEGASRPASVQPEAEEVPALPLSPEQHARRLRLRRAVGGVVAGLLAFTALATCIHVVKGRAAASSSAGNAKPVATAPSEAERPQPAPAQAAQLVALAPGSETDQAFALLHAPVTTVANLQAWSRLAGQLSLADRRRIEHDLSRSSVGGARSAQEAARLELALLWRATGRHTKAQKVLLSLARSATDPAVKKYALATLTAA